jgi:tetrahydromethanopterin S-methyltransferase subunit A
MVQGVIGDASLGTLVQNAQDDQGRVIGDVGAERTG